MKFNSLLWGIVLFSFKLRSVLALATNQYCWYSCEAALYHLTWTKGYDECSNPDYYKSQIYCAVRYCTKSEVAAGYQYANKYCIEEGSPVPSPDVIAPPSFDFDSLPLVNLSSVESAAEIDHPILLEPGVQALGLKTVDKFYKNIVWSTDFAYSLYGFWGLAILVGIGWRISELTKNRGRSSPRSHSSTLSDKSRTWLWIRRSLILPAAVGEHCQEPIAGFTIPPRLESLFILAYIALNFAYCFPGYDVFLPNLYYTQKRLQLVRYISDRTGILAVANVPILWLFANRNSILQPLTGWSFAMFNRFHRWVARIATIQAIIHSIGYTLFDFYYGDASNYYADWKAQYWYSGQIATIVMSLMLGLSIYIFRKSWYDLFLVVHIVFAIVFIVTLWYHLKIFDGEYNGYIWACVAIWSLDRLLRIVRVVYASILPRVLKRAQAVVTYDADAEIIRMDVTDMLHDKPLSPGHFYYIYQPASLRGYESHPFTLCSWRPGAVASQPSSSSPSISDEKSGIPKSSEVTIHDSSSTGNEDEIRHTFLIRPYDGFTGRLQTRISSSLESHSSAQMTVLLEGPYGENVNLTRFSDVLIIAGGSGIAIAITHAHKLLQSGNTNIRIVWMTKQRKFVEDICEHELRAVINSDRVEMIVHLTGAGVVEDDKVELGEQKPYTWHFGRPDLYAAMAEARRNCRRNLAVVSCGTPRLADACRKAVVDCLHKEGPDMQYYNETMLW